MLIICVHLSHIINNFNFFLLLFVLKNIHHIDKENKILQGKF